MNSARDFLPSNEKNRPCCRSEGFAPVGRRNSDAAGGVCKAMTSENCNL